MTTQQNEHRWTRDFNVLPFIVIWEVTRACQLHCLHCRAEAQRHRHPQELTTEEGIMLIDEIRSMDQPLLVFTGGDPLEREDLFEFIRYGTKSGLKVSITPSATPRVTRQAILRAKEAGLTRWAFSLDGSTAEIHDRFRGTAGSYAMTINALQILQEQKMPIQINTTVTRYNIEDLPRIADIAERFGVVLWSLFFLVPTGRARVQDMVSAAEHESVMRWLLDQVKQRTFDVKTTEAPHYRRVVIQQGRENDMSSLSHGRGFQVGPESMRAAKGVNDGKGFVFVSHTGDVYPSGFLPIKAGNIREARLSDLYRDSTLFRDLREPALLKGKCGRCEFKYVCGGSRARAYALTGDYLESDPSCAYEPALR